MRLKDLNPSKILSDIRKKNFTQVYFSVEVKSKDLIFRVQGDKRFIDVKISEQEEKILNEISVIRGIHYKSYFTAYYYHDNDVELLFNSLDIFEIAFEMNIYINGISIWPMSVNPKINVGFAVLIEKYKKLKDDNEKLRDLLKTQIDFSPGGPGYLEVEKHFKDLIQ